jgi:hypothetical protein
MGDYYRQQIIDAHGHTGSAAIPIASGTASGALDTLRTAIAGTSIGTQGKSKVTVSTDHNLGDTGKAVDTDAIKFNVWRVRTREATFNKEVSFSIPCADNSLTGGSVDMDLAAGVGLALVTAVEAVGESEYGSVLTVTSITFEKA